MRAGLPVTGSHSELTGGVVAGNHRVDYPLVLQGSEDGAVTDLQQNHTHKHVTRHVATQTNKSKGMIQQVVSC